jgi:two-component system phosphate regulon response regulator PhoB
MPRVLVIEDDPDVREILRDGVAEAGHEVRTAATGLEGLRLAREDPPDLVLLDLILPDTRGTSVCKQLKSERATSATRVIIVSGMGAEVDRIVGFELGADDYVVKPFSVRELILRMQAVLRGAEGADPTSIVTCGALRLDRGGHRVWVDGCEVRLPTLQFRLLVSLYSRRERVQSRAQLSADLWGVESEHETRSIDTLVTRLRHHLGSAGKYIRTVRRVGYVFSSDPAD